MLQEYDLMNILRERPRCAEERGGVCCCCGVLCPEMSQPDSTMNGFVLQAP